MEKPKNQTVKKSSDHLGKKNNCINSLCCPGDLYPLWCCERERSGDVEEQCNDLNHFSKKGKGKSADKISYEINRSFGDEKNNF